MTNSVFTCRACHGELPAGSRFCPSCGARTAADELPRLAPSESAAEATAHRDRLQRALGSAWQIVRLIGRGGFAEVYAAFDVHLRREVAVKTLRHDVEVSAQIVERFRREAESVARLRHPNIVPIYQVGEGEGLVYFMMPLIEGESLAAVLAQGSAFSVGETIRVVRDAAAALGAAHRTGVVHRDVKPDNIMLEGPERHTVVMDFGISKLVDADETRLTGTGLIMGSPHYMSPEQAAGDIDLDGRSDQYSLAVVAYQMLAGRMPFESGSVQSILFKQMTETPPPIADLRPDVPPALAAALARALSKKRDDRFPTMEGFAAALPITDRESTRATARAAFDIRARTSVARETVSRWRALAGILAIAGLAATLVGYRLTVPPAAAAVALNRGDALYAAKALLAPPAGARIYDTFEADDSLYRFTYAATGNRAVADSIAARAGVWRWRVRTEMFPLRRFSFVEIGAAGRVMSIGAAEPDSVTRPSIGGDSARVLAERVLRDRSWTVAALRFLGDSTIRRPTRMDHVLRWDAGGPVLKARDGSPALHRLAVRIDGDTVTEYHESLVPPKSAFAPRRTGPLAAIAAIMATILVGAAGILALVMMVRRGRVDDLQWRPAVVLVAVAAIPIMTYLAGATVNTGSFNAGPPGSIVASVIVLLILLGVLGAFLIVAFVVAESILAEHHPASVSGLGDVSRGRLVIPEMVTAAMIGYPAGLCFVGFSRLLEVLGRATTSDVSLSTAVDVASFSVPSLSPLPSLAMGLVAAMAIAFGVSLLLARRAPVIVALLVPAAVVVLLALSSDDIRLVWILAPALALPLTLILWRFGVFAATVAMTVYLMADGLIALLSAGDSSHFADGLIALALVAVPGAIGLLAYRQWLGDRSSQG